MTMHSHISHSIALAAPLLAVLAVLVIAGGVGVAVIDPVVTGNPNAPRYIATLSEGVDEFRMSVGKYVDAFAPTDFGGWLLTVAIFVTIWSVIKVIRELRGPVSGPGDGGALVSYSVRRTAVAIGLRAPSVVWGTVRDSAAARPLPLATVRLVGADGGVVDQCITDCHGRYGFRLSHADTMRRGYQVSLEARKDGHYFPPARRAATVAHAHGVDVIMDRKGDEPVVVHQAHPLWHAASSVAFWLGVLLVPVAFLQQPDLLHGALFTMFLGVVFAKGALIVRK